MNRRTINVLTLILLAITLTPITSSLGETPLTEDPATDWAPSITQTSDGKIWVVWHSNRFGNADIFYKIYDGSWSNEIQLTTDPTPDVLPAIIQTANGTIWVFWASSRNGNFDLYYKKGLTETELKNSEETPFTTDPSTDKRPSIMETSDGKIWVVWHSNRFGNADIFYKIYDGSWSNEIQLTTDPSDDRDPSVIQTTDGTIWVFWDSLRNGNFDLYYKKGLTETELKNSEETRLTTDPDADICPSAMQAEDEITWVVWQSDRGIIQEDLYYKTHNGSSWSPENQLTIDMSNDFWASITQAMNGTTWVVWVSDRPGNYDLYYKFVIIDVAIINIVPSSTKVYQGNLIEIYPVIENEGTASVIVNVTTYYNQTIIDTQTVTSFPTHFPSWVTSTWNTTGVPYGYYTISANATTALGETDLTNNFFADSTILVAIPGDANNDGTVDDLDLYRMGKAYGSSLGGPNWDPECDINSDDIVDDFDLNMVSKNFGKTM